MECKRTVVTKGNQVIALTKLTLAEL
jgi:hypothetical protein